MVAGTVVTRYRTLFDYAPIGIVYADADSRYIDANDHVCEMLGYTRDEFIGLSAADIVADADTPAIGPALDAINADADHQREWTLRRKDGSLVTADVKATRLPDGTLLGIIRDISELKKREREVARLSRLYAALSQVNQAIVWSRTPDELFRKVCRTLVEQGGLRLARIVWRPPESGRIETLAEWAGGDPLAERADDDAIPECWIPCREVLATGQSWISNDLLDNPEIQPWKAAYERRGFRSSAALPVRRDGRIFGVLSVYGDRPDVFRDKELQLLEEAAADLSFALDMLDRDDNRRVAEETLRGEKAFSDSMIESMPGILYFYDTRGRFLRWNRNFETVSGYRGDEIASMHPRDFFSEQDRPRVEERIAEVFEKGESSLEAGFVTRDGTATPYFFTGRRVSYEGQTCLVGVGIDISERQRAERRLAENEQKYRELVEHANSIILRWTVQGRITFLNEFGQRFFGYAEPEIVGRHVTETIVPRADSEGRDLVRLMDEICAAPEAFAQSINENMCRDGRRVWIAWTNRVVRDADGTITGFLSIGTDVTARRQAETALREAELRFHTLFEQTPVGVVVVDPDTATIVECNDQAALQLGYTPQEFAGLHIADIDAAGSIEDRRRRVEALKTEGRNKFETRHRTRSGEIRDVWVSGRPVQLGGRTLIHCVFVDITERKRAEARLRESEAHLRDAQRIAGIGSWELDIGTGGLTWSDQVFTIFGLERKAYPGSYQAFLSFVHPLDRERLVAAQAAALAGEARLDIEHRIVLRDGTEKVVHELADLKRDAAGRPVTLAGTVHDITDRARMQAEQEKRQQAEAADRIKSAFLATMSHELRTPLNSIIGFTGIMLQGLAGPLNGEQAKQLDIVRTSARHLLALVNDVLDISKIEAGQLEVAREPFDLRRSVEKVLAIARAQADAKGLRLHAALAPTLGIVVGDERRFEQILLNLLSNAIKFTEQGDVGLKAECVPGTVLPGATAGLPAVRISVSDTGIGIRPEDLPALFQPFRQIDSGLARKHDGTGLGLAICRRLAALMGGEISAESEFGKGSTFCVVLPLREAVGS